MRELDALAPLALVAVAARLGEVEHRERLAPRDLGLGDGRAQPRQPQLVRLAAAPRALGRVAEVHRAALDVAVGRADALVERDELRRLARDVLRARARLLGVEPDERVVPRVARLGERVVHDLWHAVRLPLRFQPVARVARDELGALERTRARARMGGASWI